MNLKTLTEKEIISLHLHLLEAHDEKTTVFSSLTAALRDARLNTGRDLETGKDISTESSKLGNWSGAICYMIILDQLGKCYKPKGKLAYSNLNSFTRCLKYYTHLSDAEVDALYALRNAFAHDYSISNSDAKHDSLRHHFTLLGERASKFIVLPSKPWGGFPDQKTPENVTYISLPYLGDLVEEIWKVLLEINQRNELEIILKGGAKEIQTRYLQFIRSINNSH